MIQTDPVLYAQIGEAMLKKACPVDIAQRFSITSQEVIRSFEAKANFLKNTANTAKHINGSKNVDIIV